MKCMYSFSCLAVYVDLVIQLEDYNANGIIQIKFFLKCARTCWIEGRWFNSPKPIFVVCVLME